MPKRKPPKVDLREITEKMMRNPDEWPQWPILPMKRYVKGENIPETGIFFYTSGGVPKFAANANMWEPTALDGAVETNIPDLLDSGWIVD